MTKVEKPNDCKIFHDIKIVYIGNGNYDVTCKRCDWWTTIPNKHPG